MAATFCCRHLKMSVIASCHPSRNPVPGKPGEIIRMAKVQSSNLKVQSSNLKVQSSNLKVQSSKYNSPVFPSGWPKFKVQSIHPYGFLLSETFFLRNAMECFIEKIYSIGTIGISWIEKSGRSNAFRPIFQT